MARNRSWLLLVLLMELAAFAAGAQLGPLADPSQAPQAQTQEEFDQYLGIIAESDPKQVIQRVAEFVHAFPDSRLAGVAYQYEMHAREETGDIDGMLAAGKLALAANSDNLNTLLTLAPAAANAAPGRKDRAELLAEAQTWASSALVALEKTKAPRQWPLAKWMAEKRRMQAEAHETLGVIALDEADSATAVREFQTAVDLQPAPDGSRFLRLGLALLERGTKDEAVKNMQRAAELGPEPVRTIALKLLKTAAASSGSKK